MMFTKIGSLLELSIHSK